mmetsp:Transcript_39916/g.65386  ORF Transcript_39916/g.65386 Transcript_39916/m.65386 type:complete len:81 (-) Transcript_39916:37-279(-)
MSPTAGGGMHSDWVTLVHAAQHTSAHSKDTHTHTRTHTRTHTHTERERETAKLRREACLSPAHNTCITWGRAGKGQEWFG